MSSSLHQQLSQAVPPSALPPPLPSSLDHLVDRLNASSGHSPASSSSGSGSSSTSTGNNGGSSGSSSSSASASGDKPAPIRAILVGTNEGAPLHRSFGSSYSTRNRPHGLSEEILGGIESLWSTLPSSAPPHVMAAAQAADAAASAAAGVLDTVSGSAGPDGRRTVVNDAQPPHPLLTPLGLGDDIRCVTVFYETVTLLHVHMSPLVVTLLCGPSANIGAVRTVALPLLEEILNPVRKAILISRRETLTGLTAGGGGGGGGGGAGGAAIGPGGAAINSTAMEEAFAAGFRAGSFPRGGVVGAVPTEYYRR